MTGALQMRAALGRVSIAARRTWAARHGQTCGVCQQTGCAYPSHWSGTTLDAAFAALVTDVEGAAEAMRSNDDDTAAVVPPAVKTPPVKVDHGATDTVHAAGDLAAALERALSVARPDPNAIDAAVESALTGIRADVAALQELATAPRAREIEVKVADRAAVNVGVVHKQFPLLLNLLAAGDQVWIAGPTGSGKTTAVEQAACALGLPFHFNGAIDTEYKLSGFVDAGGRIVSTAFRRAYEGGGVYLFDEVDASMPSAVLAFNAALANGFADFPGADAPIPRSPKFYCCAAANTIGLGGTFEYVGRAKMDAAFLDRFSILLWEYDEELERTLAGNDKWTTHVQTLRARAQERGLRVILSPRASIRGARKLAAGMSWADVERTEISDRMTPDTFKALGRA